MSVGTSCRSSGISSRVIWQSLAKTRTSGLAEKYEEEMPGICISSASKGRFDGICTSYGLYDTTPYDKLKMDLMYIEKYSLLLDLQILLMTIKTALFPGESNEELHEQTHIPVQKHVAEPEAAASEEKKENKSS